MALPRLFAFYTSRRLPPASCLLPPASCLLPPAYLLLTSCHLPRIVAYHPLLDVEARGHGDDEFRVAGGSPPRGGPAVFPQAQDKARSSLTLSACRANKGLWRGAGEPAFKGE